METDKIKQGIDFDGEQATADKNEEAASPNTNHGQASFRTGSTTQGGSNFGQGSSDLGNETYRQGEAKSDGSNYDNESEELTTKVRQEGTEADRPNKP